ncbi:MAG: pyridoxal-dependent decarboxylase, partial [Gammaproteobacteria bacterium]
MKITIEKRANRIVVACSGRLDAVEAPKLEQAVVPLLSETDLPVHLDLQQLSYLSSAGIRTLLVIHRAADAPWGAQQARVRIQSLSPVARQVLELSGIGKQPDLSPPHALQGSAGYAELLDTVRNFFPAPVSDAERDAYLVQSINQGLHAIDALKTQRPYLGRRLPLDYESARRAELADNASNVEQTIAEMADYLDGLMIWSHPHSQANVSPPATIPSAIGQLFGALYNPNVIWDEASHRVGQAEVETASICAALIGYDAAEAAGFFTFGGTGTVLYGAKLGVEKAAPGAMKTGVPRGLRVVSSDVGHYAKLNVLGWLGIGTDGLISIPTDEDNSMRHDALEASLRGILNRGEKIACIIATLGTTDAFGIDNLHYIVRLRDRLVAEYDLPYRPHVHADAVIGWAWSVFNDYDFDTNPMGFPPRTLRSLWDTSVNVRALGMADSVGLDFHKTGFGPYTSSLFLCKNRKDLELITRDTALMPYIFQFGNYHPGVFTLETSRCGGAILASLANLKLLGKEGYRTLLGHIVGMAEILRERLEKLPQACLVNTYNYGPVTLFRVYPDGVDAAEAFHAETTRPELKEQLLKHNAYNRR